VTSQTQAVQSRRSVKIKQRPPRHISWLCTCLSPTALPLLVHSSALFRVTLLFEQQPTMSSAAATSSSRVLLLVSGATGCLRRPSSQRSHAALMTTASARKKQGRVSLVFAPRAASGSSSSYGETSREGKVPRHNVSIGGYNPTGGDESMDEARVVDPYGCVGGRVAPTHLAATG